MIHRISGDWLHWQIGPGHMGFHRRGPWPFRPRWTRYANHHFFEFWRFFISFPRHDRSSETES